MANTLLTTDPRIAADILKRGGVVAFPTETVYGLGANVFDAAAVARIFEAKMRPADNPLIAHIAEIGQIERLASFVAPSAKAFIDAFFPGALTLVMPKTDAVPLVATAGLDTIGVRMPKSALAHEFLKFCETPVVAPSANLSGRPSPTSWEAVFEDLDGRIDCILQGDATEIGLESTVVDVTSEVPLLLRAGAVSLEDLRRVVPETRRYEPAAGEAVRSPGLKHRHYSPSAKVVLVSKLDLDAVEDASTAAFIGISTPTAAFGLSKVCADVNQYAHEVFAFFRDCDHRGIKTIYCESVNETGLGAALMDRLRRACAG